MRFLLFLSLFVFVFGDCETSSHIYTLPSLSSLEITNSLGRVSLCITNEKGVEVVVEKDETIQVDTTSSGTTITIVATLLEERISSSKILQFSWILLFALLGYSVQRKYFWFILVPIVMTSALCSNITVKIPSGFNTAQIKVNGQSIDGTKIAECFAATDIFISGSSSAPLGTTSIATTSTPTTSVATTGVATTAVPTTSAATSGVATTAVATTRAATTGVATTGVATTGIATTGVATTRAATTGVATTGVATTAVPTTGVATTRAATTGVVTTGVATTGVATTGVPTPIINDGPRIAFRFTQVQDYWNDGILVPVMNLFRSKNASITLGILGGPDFGSRQYLMASLREALITPGWNVEIAANGWKYEDFTTLSIAQQGTLATNIVDRLRKLFGVSIKSFIAPFDSYNANTVTALTNAGITVLSSALETATFPSSGQTFYKFPYSVTMQNPNNPNTLQTQAQIMTAIQNSITANGFAVVDIDPAAMDNNPATPTNVIKPAALTLLTNVLTASLGLVMNNKQASVVTLQGIINPKVTPPVPNFTALGTGRVAWRLDDVCDEFLAPAQKAIMDVFAQENMPLTAGVITHTYGVQNTYQMTTYIANRLNTDPNFELACHGYDHEDFKLFDLNGQKTLLNHCKDVLRTQHNWDCKIFMPPYNSIDGNTTLALKETAYTMLSSETSQDIPLYFHNDPQLWKFPIGAQTADFVGNLYKITAASNTMAQIRQQLLAYGFAAVMIHPQEYSQYNAAGTEFLAGYPVNATAINELRSLLQMAKTAGFINTNLGQLASYTWPY